MTFARDPSQWVEDAAAFPGRLFLKNAQGRELSYAALRELSGRMAGALSSLGVRSGDRVAVQVEKSIEAVLLYIACLRMGAVFVPINVANTANEVEYFLRDSRPTVAVVRPQDRAAIEAVARAAGAASLETMGLDSDGSLCDLASRSGDFEAPATMDPK